jgi:SAM-dependent methyltransferase
MDYRKEYLNNLFSNSIKTIFKAETLKKIITRPWRIPSAIHLIYKNANIINSDVKLKPLSTEYLLSTVNESVAALATLSQKQNNVSRSIKKLEDIFNVDALNDPDCVNLASLLKSYGSDKSTDHNYYIAYATLLKGKKEQPINILEIGLGTNNIDVMSNMGTFGKPGASLRSFRDMYKNANIYGADVDKRILFSEERIKTFFVDQTNPASFDELKKQLNGIQFDLIIDDGLHNSQANLNTTNFALDLLKPDGIFIIEDVGIADFQYYQITEAILKNKFTVDFVATKSQSCICIFKKIIA